MMNQKYIVINRWEKSYPDIIILEKGEEVIIDFSIKDSTPGWENWVWCVFANKQGGWFPIQILEITNSFSDDKKAAIVLENYSTNELTVEKGEILIGEKILNGWIWCWKQDDNIKGWVPLDNVQVFFDL